MSNSQNSINMAISSTGVTSGSSSTGITPASLRRKINNGLTSEDGSGKNSQNNTNNGDIAYNTSASNAQSHVTQTKQVPITQAGTLPTQFPAPNTPDPRDGPYAPTNGLGINQNPAAGYLGLANPLYGLFGAMLGVGGTPFLSGAFSQLTKRLSPFGRDHPPSNRNNFESFKPTQGGAGYNGPSVGGQGGATAKNNPGAGSPGQGFPGASQAPQNTNKDKTTEEKITDSQNSTNQTNSGTNQGTETTRQEQSLKDRLNHQEKDGEGHRIFQANLDYLTGIEESEQTSNLKEQLNNFDEVFNSGTDEQLQKSYDELNSYLKEQGYQNKEGNTLTVDDLYKSPDELKNIFKENKESDSDLSLFDNLNFDDDWVLDV